MVQIDQDTRGFMLRLSALVAVIVGGAFAASAYSTHPQMEKFRIGFPPGTAVSELVGFAGKPNIIIRKGEPLESGFRSFQVPKLDETTVVYVDTEEGFPYYDVFVLVNEITGNILSSEVVDLW